MLDLDDLGTVIVKKSNEVFVIEECSLFMRSFLDLAYPKSPSI
jgi:hypothetical protein